MVANGAQEEGIHNYTSMIQYIYHALPVFDRMMGPDEDTADTTADFSHMFRSQAGMLYWICGHSNKK